MLVDFIVETTMDDGEIEVGPCTVIEEPEWLFYVDRSSTGNRSKRGIILVIPDHIQLNLALRFVFKVSNNEVEYKAFIVGLRMAHAVGAK